MSPGSDNAWHHQPLPWLVLASLALHAGLLAWQAPRQQEIPALSSRSGTLAVQLTAPPAPGGRHEAADVQPAVTAAADSDNQRSRTEPSSSTPPAPAPDPVAEARTPSAEPGRRASIDRPESAPAARPAATPTTARPAQSRTGPRGSAVLEEVRDALQQHFFYPRLARLRNWEGDVLLGFQVRSDGRIHEVEVLESSGRAVLDQAALSALRSVRQVAYNATRPVDLQLPVAYRLH